MTPPSYKTRLPRITTAYLTERGGNKKIKDPVPRTVYDEPYIERALSHLSLLLYYCVSHSIESKPTLQCPTGQDRWNIWGRLGLVTTSFGF